MLQQWGDLRILSAVDYQVQASHYYILWAYSYCVASDEWGWSFTLFAPHREPWREIICISFIKIVDFSQSALQTNLSWNLSLWTFKQTLWINMSENLTVTLEAITDHSKKIVKSKRLSFVQSNLLSLMKSVFPLQVYKVVVNFGDHSWFIFRRYNEFHSLHEKVSTVYFLSKYQVTIFELSVYR